MSGPALLTMNAVAQLSRRVLHPAPFLHFLSRAFCNCSLDGDGDGVNATNDFGPIEKLIREFWKSSNVDACLAIY